jgi:hypothetical protein
MTDATTTAIVAGIAAVIGGGLTAIFGPWVKHSLEQKSTLKSQRREQIRKWRAMLLEVQRDCEYANEVGQHLQLHPDFLSLEPLLKEQVRRALYGENRTLVFGQSLAAPLQQVKLEIARIESEWGLA